MSNANRNMLACPRCKCALEVSVGAEYDDWTEYRVEAVPLRDQPCTADTIGPRPEWYTWPNTDRRGVECNRLGAGRNDPSHVTPVTRHNRDGMGVMSNMRDSARLLGVARCVQGK